MSVLSVDSGWSQTCSHLTCLSSTEIKSLFHHIWLFFKLAYVTFTKANIWKIVMFLKSLVSFWLAIVIDHLILPFINLFTHYDFMNVFILLKRLSTIMVGYFDVQMVLDLTLLICFKKIILY